MKLYAPSYYKDFVCIADKCQHSCCIGWEIDIDDESARKYATLDTDYGQCINSSIDFDDIPHFRLGDDERCPHLADSGLCNIICELGEDFLCDICREHPRFYNFAKTVFIKMRAFFVFLEYKMRGVVHGNSVHNGSAIATF